ncbi:hypothetical protein SCP_0803630 [Sparassis crispa]|uniref:Uncharacterized protein n=1 Tax=Sparassis crispa TaxID=139825 RepID=A0A401GUE2_9APHY|nr:hypothetical protein SCP_0803630 [Sparassis crispa]GBE85841.1 hypothetical protein SCP_0803630 [Sparassis crispa]
MSENAVDSQEYGRLVRRIKTLTTVLYTLQLSLKAPRNIAGPQSGHTKTYYHIATLLGGGIQATDDAHGSKVIAVTGKSTSEGTLVVISEQDSNWDTPVNMLAASQDSQPLQELAGALDIDWVHPSKKTLHSLGSSK